MPGLQPTRHGCAVGPRRSIRGGDAEAERGRIRLRAPADVVAAKVPARYVTVAPDGADACIVTTTGRWSREFLIWMASLDLELEVLEPQELADKTGYTRPHTVHCGPGGIYISALGNKDGKGPGGVLVMDHDSFEPLGRWEVDRGPQQSATTRGGIWATTRW